MSASGLPRHAHAGAALLNGKFSSARHIVHSVQVNTGIVLVVPAVLLRAVISRPSDEYCRSHYSNVSQI